MGLTIQMKETVLLNASQTNLHAQMERNVSHLHTNAMGTMTAATIQMKGTALLRKLLATLDSFNVQLVKNALIHHGNVMEIMTAETIQTKETVQLRKVMFAQK